MFDFVGKKWLYFIISGIIIIPGLVSLLLFGLKLSIDFTGGTLLEMQINSKKEVTNEKIKNIVTKQGMEVGSIQSSGDKTYILRMKPIDTNQNEKIQKAIRQEFGDAKELRFETVGPTIGGELTQKAFLAIIVASGMIVLYIAWSFRQIPKPYASYKFGICAVVALLHDVFDLVRALSQLG